MESHYKMTDGSNLNSSIDFVNFIYLIISNKKNIIKYVIIFIIIGTIIALFSPNQYTSYSTMIVQNSNNSTSNIGGLAALAGINIGYNNGELLGPSTYPKILNNIDFQKELINKKIDFNSSKIPISIFDYYSNSKKKPSNIIDNITKYTVGLPSLIFNSLITNKIKNRAQNISSSHLKQFSNDEKKIITNLYKNISFNINDRTGLITLSVTMSEPIFATELVIHIQDLLQKYLTNFKLQKVRNNLNFVETNYKEAKSKFEFKQQELARFRDENKNVTSSLYKTTEEIILSEYNLLLSIYNELSKQREQAKIAVTENTPILTIIQPAVVPIEKTSPNRMKIVVIFGFIGLILQLIILTFKYFMYTKNGIQ